ncbi:MAG: rod shape-determining protein MreC [Candidatus Berkelbacteria bacterium]|nr:rod shape-determining protein MreC [Candidatus Berkelbacteria bacterium]
MKKKESFLPVFFFFLFLSILLLGLSKTGFLTGIESVLGEVTRPINRAFFGVFGGLSHFGEDTKEINLKEENQALLKKLIDQENLEKENQALRDQFQTTSPSSKKLLSAEIVGAPGFIPGVSDPENLIIDKGLKNNLYVGQAVVFEDNLVGKIVRLSAKFSVVDIITSKSFSLTGKTLETGAMGVTKGQGEGEIILDNVLLSENLKTGDVVLTKGELNFEGKGIPANLIIGKILSVEKKPSALFQRANVKTLLNYSKLSTVFVVTP